MLLQSPEEQEVGLHFTFSHVLNSRVHALPACVVREASPDFCCPVQILSAGGSGPCHIHFCDCTVSVQGVSYSSRVLFHRKKNNIEAFRLVQHLVVVISTWSNTWDVLQKSDFQVLLETRLLYFE